MKFPISPVAFVALATLPSIVSAWDMNIHFQRYNGPACENDTSIGKEVAVGKKCHSWKDGESFATFVYTWAPAMPWGWKVSDYGDCEIKFWEEEHCEGRYLGQLRHANTWEKLGSCSGHFADIDGRPGYPKSTKIVCRKKSHRRGRAAGSDLSSA